MSRPELNVYFPMVRAATRSMDAMTEFMEDTYGTTLEKFIFTGLSKRGWTTWLMGGMDQKKRVEGIIPVVWDAINFPSIFRNQWKSFNGWSWAIEPYWENNITLYFDTPEMIHLQNMIDPYHYRTRLTVPKLVVTGLMDEFQMTDDERYWWDEMPSGPTGNGAYSDGNTKWLIKAPNAEHSQYTNVCVWIPVVGRWVSYLLNGWDIPYLTWDYNPANGDIITYPKLGDVYSAQMWHSTSCNDVRRDFRIMSLDDPCECGFPDREGDGFCVQNVTKWEEVKLMDNGDGSYTAHLDDPMDGKWRSFIVNVQMTTSHTYDLDDEKHTYFTKGDDQICADDTNMFFPKAPAGAFEFTTRSSMVPDTFNYEMCEGLECKGTLL